MPRKPVPSFERTVNLPFGKLQLVITGNPLTFSPADRAMFNHVLEQVEVIDGIVKRKDDALPVAPAGSAAAAAADTDRQTKH